MFDNWFRKTRILVPTITRSAERQATVDALTADLALYHFDGCGFCTRVRKAIVALELRIELRDIMKEREHYRDLLSFGGRTTVPCLCIGTTVDPGAARWMYESRDIIAYLVDRFGAAP